jgi:hypothetical protein
VEYDYLKNRYPKLVEALGEYLFVEEKAIEHAALPVVFIFIGDERQQRHWMKTHGFTDNRTVRRITDVGRLQGMRARAVPVQVDAFWQPMGIDERLDAGAGEWYIKDMCSKVGDLWDIRNQVNPIPDNEKWVRLA